MTLARAIDLRCLRGLLLLCVLMVPPLTARAADEDRVKAFLTVTGFDVALDSIAHSAADAPALLGMNVSDFGSDWSRLSEEVFDQTVMRNMAIDILSQALTDDLLSHAADFYASALGQRLVEVENQAHMDADDDGKQSKGREIVAKLVEDGSDRVTYLSRALVAIDSSGTNVKAIQEIQVRFLMAASRAGILEYELDETLLRNLLSEDEAELRVALKEAALAASAHTYRDISDEDLRAYAEALEHPDMQQVYQLMNAVQYEIMANRFETLAAKMADIYPGQEL